MIFFDDGWVLIWFIIKVDIRRIVVIKIDGLVFGKLEFVVELFIIVIFI